MSTSISCLRPTGATLEPKWISLFGVGCEKLHLLFPVARAQVLKSIADDRVTVEDFHNPSLARLLCRRDQSQLRQIVHVIGISSSQNFILSILGTEFAVHRLRFRFSPGLALVDMASGNATEVLPSRTSQLLFSTIFFSVLGTSFVVARFYARFAKSNAHGWDDYFLALSVVRLLSKLCVSGSASPKGLTNILANV